MKCSVTLQQVLEIVIPEIHFYSLLQPEDYRAHNKSKAMLTARVSPAGGSVEFLFPQLEQARSMRAVYFCMYRALIFQLGWVQASCLTFWAKARCGGRVTMN